MLLEDRVLSETDVPSDGDILTAVQQHTDTFFVTVTKCASNRVNSVIINKLFHKQRILKNVTFANSENFNIYRGMKVMITENRDKSRYFVNGTVGTIERMEKCTIYVRLRNGCLLGIYKIFREGTCYYPIMPGYCSTIYKVQGKTLNHITIWFDNDIISPGTGYTALSRVRKLKDISFLRRPKKLHFTPVKR